MCDYKYMYLNIHIKIFNTAFERSCLKFYLGKYTD